MLLSCPVVSTITLLSQKGGSGKTTLAVALAVAHQRTGGTAAVLDLDPQGSARFWGNLRSGESPPVVTTHPPLLARVLAAARSNGADLVMIDTAPRAAAGAVEAARVSELVLIPCRPALPDLAAIPASLEVARLADTPAVVVLNAAPPRGNLVAQAIEALQDLDAECCPLTLGARVAHVRSFTSGLTAQEVEPRSPAAAEIEALYRWIQEAAS